MEQKIGFIGCGNMGRAILGGYSPASMRRRKIFGCITAPQIASEPLSMNMA
ncbi:Pyrroline-5-carboxylate reductase [Edwardsiella tarda]|nr:Pyrroline-5-carboxylate reductase [Edwardsiella tarda]